MSLTEHIVRMNEDGPPSASPGVEREDALREAYCLPCGKV